jgi:lysophospholipase L1-like esterase
MRRFVLLLTLLGLINVCVHAQKEKSVMLEDIGLFLPEVVYAVPGVEMNVYFDNLVQVTNSANYVFDVNCTKGRNDQLRWRFLPTEKDVGIHDWSIKVYGQQGLVAEGSSKLVVSALDKVENRQLSILVVGDSLTAANAYPTRIFALSKEPGKMAMQMIGSCGNGPERSAIPGEVAYEGYGGWSWSSFVKGKNSKFLQFPDNDNSKTGTLNFQAYLDQHNAGKAPDVITIMLGINDIFAAQDDTIDSRIETIFADMELLLREFRRVAPDALLGVALIPPGAGSQDAFGANYNCGQTRWQYTKNQRRYNSALLAKFTADNSLNVSLVPVYINLDCLHNYPQLTSEINHGNKATITRLNNGVHPSSAGYNQIGDSFFSWLVAQLGK